MAPNFSLLILLFPLLFHLVEPFDINKILSQFSDFSSFADYLDQTHLADEINSRSTITVLAVDNSAIGNHPTDALKKILAVHVILDYYDDAKLRQLPNKSVVVPTLYQATGLAFGQAGFLNITDAADGHITVGSAAPGSGPTADLVKVLVTHPYNISVVQISRLVVPPGIGGAVPPQPSRTPTPAAAPTGGGAAMTPSEAPAKVKPKSPPPASAPEPAEAPETGAPAPESGGSAAPMKSPPAPPLAPAEAPTASGVAEVPSAAAGTAESPTVRGDGSGLLADRARVGAGLAALMVVTVLG